MFCSFASTPRILRFFCWGKVVEWDQPGFEGLIQKMGKEKIPGARAVILLNVFKVRERSNKERITKSPPMMISIFVCIHGGVAHTFFFG